MWQPISSYIVTDKIFNDGPEVLLYSKQTGTVIGSGTLYDDYEGGFELAFSYSHDGLLIEPTHWMPIPESPSEPVDNTDK